MYMYVCVYLWRRQVKLAHSVLGRILLCFLFSLFFAYLFLIIIKLFSDPINLAYPSACIGIGESLACWAQPH